MLAPSESGARRATRGNDDAISANVRRHSEGRLAGAAGPFSSPRCPSAREARLGNALHAEIVDGEEAAAEDAVAWEAGQGGLCHRGHEEDVEVGAAEHHAGDLLHGHGDDAVDGAVRRIADDL